MKFVVMFNNRHTSGLAFPVEVEADDAQAAIRAARAKNPRYGWREWRWTAAPLETSEAGACPL